MKQNVYLAAATTMKVFFDRTGMKITKFTCFLILATTLNSAFAQSDISALLAKFKSAKADSDKIASYNELFVVPGAYHGFDILMPEAPISQAFISDITDALQRNIK